MLKNLCSESTCKNFGRYCRTHLQDEEKELKQDTKEYLKLRADYLKAHPTCQFGTCQKKATEIHHKKGRGKKYLCDPKTFLSVCSGHHKFIEEHPHYAKENGYSLSRHSKTNSIV